MEWVKTFYRIVFQYFLKTQSYNFARPILKAYHGICL